MNLLDIVKSKRNDFKELLATSIQDKIGNTVGWNCTAYTNNDEPIGSGTNSRKNIAIRICIAELIERVFFKEIYYSDLKDEFLISKFPTTCGFACGFDNDFTKIRSICEGLERWTWSQWIDYGYQLEQVVHPENLDALETELASRFDSVNFYERYFYFQNQIYTIGVCIGFHKNGVFAGSRVCLKGDSPWFHAVVEAYRNFKNFKYYEENKNEINTSQFVRIRAIYFGNHKSEALLQINLAKKTDWPVPELRLLKSYDTKIPGVFIWRCIFKNWVGWHIGKENRFVY